jgi:SulP family sulfate permease
VSAVSAASQWGRTLAQPGGIARGDLAGGLTAALVLPAIEGSYGLLAFAPLGPEHAQIGFLLGAFAAAITSVVSLAAGGRGPLLCGSSAALALLLASLIAWLIQDPYFLGADGQPFMKRVLAFVALGVTLAGLMQILLGRLKLGGLVRYVPYPVHAGYMNGVAVLMLAAVLPFVLGLSASAGLPAWRDTRPLAPLIALVALWVALKPPAWTRRVPPYLLALLVASALHHLLAATPVGGALGPLFNPPQFQWPELQVTAPLLEAARDGMLLDKLGPLLLFAAAVAMMSSLQTALAGSTIGEMTRKRRDGEREIFAQGVANVAAGLVGALPGAASTTRSKLNIDAGGVSGMSRLVFGIGLVLALAVGLRFMNMVPTAAIAGVFAAVAFSLVDDWTRRATRVLWQQIPRRHVPRLLAQSYVVMLLVAAVTIFLSLALAIALGTLVAMILFIRSNVKHPVRRVAHADHRTSRKVRPAAQAELLRAHGARIALIELDGALFFGTAETADQEIERLTHGADTIVIDFHRVNEVDASGARVLLQAADLVQRAGRCLLLAGLPPRDARTRTIRDMDVHERLTDAQFFPDADRALEHAEDRLLADLSPADLAAAGPLALAHTLLGAGLDADELALLQSLMLARPVARGAAVFRTGEPGDALFVSLQGSIGIWLPGSADDADGPRNRRMVSYAPGVAFGEIGLLEGRARSADAIAEDDALVLELPRAHYEQLARKHPALHAKLLLNLGTLLASRVRALTDELRAEELAR